MSKLSTVNRLGVGQRLRADLVFVRGMVRALTLISGLTLLVSPAYAAGDGATPPFISVGFNEYSRYGAEAGWAGWKIDYGEKQAQKKASFLDAAKNVEKRYGRMMGFELIHTNEISPSYKNVYVLWRFEKAPQFCFFVCYRAKDEWRILDFVFGDDPRAYLPTSVLELPGR